MSSQLLSPNREAGIWARLMQSHRDELSPDVAEYLLTLAFGENDQERMRQLAERSESGELTDAEQREFDSYLHVGNRKPGSLWGESRTSLAREPGACPEGLATSSAALRILLATRQRLSAAARSVQRVLQATLVARPG